MEFITVFLICAVYGWFINLVPPDSEAKKPENKVMDINKIVHFKHFELLKNLDSMLWQEFESFLLCLLGKLGYWGYPTAASGDYGADLIIYKDGLKIVVQAKRYSKPVGMKAVQEALGAVNYYNASKAIVITNSRFTKQAHKLAASNNVDLWDRSVLLDLIQLVKQKSGDDVSNS